jgi:hypothetical protein
MTDVDRYLTSGEAYVGIGRLADILARHRADVLRDAADRLDARLPDQHLYPVIVDYLRRMAGST